MLDTILGEDAYLTVFSLVSVPVYCFLSSTQNTKAWKRKKIIIGRVMRWMMAQTTVPRTSASIILELTFCRSKV